MKVRVQCPTCKIDCDIVLEKTLSINKDILFVCPICKNKIPVRLFKTKDQGLWYFAKH